MVHYVVFSMGLLLGAVTVLGNDREALEQHAAELERSRQLRSALLEVVEVFSGDILYFTTSERFDALDVSSRRRLLNWCYRTVPYMRSLCFDKVPEVSLFDLGIMTHWMKRFLESDEAGQTYGEARVEFLEYVGRLDHRVNRLLEQRLEPQEYIDLQQELERWVDANPKGMRMRYQVASALAVEHLGLGAESDAEPRHWYDITKRRGGFLTGQLESTIESTNIQVNEIELEMERIADHLEWMPVYTSWVMHLLALNYLDSGPLVDELEQLHELSVMRGELEQLTKALAPLAQLSTTLHLRIDTTLDTFAELEAHMTPIKHTLASHEAKVQSIADALEQIASVLTDRSLLLWLAALFGVSLGVVCLLCVLLYRSVGRAHRAHSNSAIDPKSGS
jgi:hypothetical protein